MILDVEIMASEEVDISVEDVAAEDVEEEVYKVEKDASEEVMEEAVAHTKMVLTSQMSPITLKIKSGTQSKTIQGKISLRTRYAKSS